jgi:bifunctional NMN adenylyltransferase/nudix hydrolase
MKVRVGVVVGRFQVPTLTNAHRNLLQSALKDSDILYVFVGEGHVRVDTKDPIPAKIVYDMVSRHVGLATRKRNRIEIIQDHPSNKYWSELLDKEIETFLAFDTSVNDEVEVVLFGGRDSFIPHYSGKFLTQYVENVEDSVSGTKIREELKDANRALAYVSDLLYPEHEEFVHEAFRAGIIHAAHTSYPISYQCVDMIAYTRKLEKVVMVEKEGHGVIQLPGGFVDVCDDSLETAALRELKEETGIVGNVAVYESSHRIDDWRYRNRRDKIMTTLFAVPIDVADLKYAKAADDVMKLHLINPVDLVKMPEGSVHPSHHAMIKSWFKHYSI